MEEEYYTAAEESVADNTEILLQQLIAEQGSNRRCINAILLQLKKDAEDRERTYGPVRFLCWVQIFGMMAALLLFVMSLFVR